jgi:hypothetical protein
MSDEDRRYSDAERRSYKSPRCPTCKGPTIQQWVRADNLTDPPGVNYWIPGTYACRNPAGHPR